MAKKPTDLLEYSGRSWRDCKELIDKEVTTQKPSTSDALEYKTIRLLPRKDFSMYGEFPKVDTKVLLECEKCGQVLLPCRFVAHCSHPDHDKLSASVTTGSKQTASHKNSKPSNYIPPGTSLLKKKYQQPKNKKKSGLPPPVPPPPLFAFQKTCSPPSATMPVTAEIPVISQPPGKPCSPPQPVNSTPPSTHTSSGKHKKNKKSAKRSKDDTEKVEKTEKAEKPDKPEKLEKPEKTEASSVPKLVTAAARKESSKVIIMAARKESNKVKEFQHTQSDSTTEVIVARPIINSTTSSSNRCVPSFIINQPQVPPTQQKQIDALQPLQVAVTPSHAQDTINNNQSSIVYMPMSPVAVVNNVPLQFIKLPLVRVTSTQPMLSPPLTSQPLVVTIPIQDRSIPMYSLHPKPLSMTTRAIRKIGSTYLLQNQRIFHQRSEVQSIVNTRRSISNSCSTLNSFHHRPNILKNSAKSNVKVTVKRSASDKLMNDNKHIRLNDVNGFILHADVSESAEAPLHNNSVHDKVTFLNMK